MMQFAVNKFYEPFQAIHVTQELLANKEFVDIYKRLDEYGYQLELTIRPIKRNISPNMVFHPYEMLLVAKDKSYYITICACTRLKDIRQMIVDMFSPMETKEKFEAFIEHTKKDDKWRMGS